MTQISEERSVTFSLTTLGGAGSDSDATQNTNTADVETAAPDYEKHNSSETSESVTRSPSGVELEDSTEKHAVCERNPEGCSNDSCKCDILDEGYDSGRHHSPHTMCWFHSRTIAPESPRMHYRGHHGGCHAGRFSRDFGLVGHHGGHRWKHRHHYGDVDAVASFDESPSVKCCKRRKFHELHNPSFVDTEMQAEKCEKDLMNHFGAHAMGRMHHRGGKRRHGKHLHGGSSHFKHDKLHSEPTSSTETFEGSKKSQYRESEKAEAVGTENIEQSKDKHHGHGKHAKKHGDFSMKKGKLFEESQVPYFKGFGMRSWGPHPMFMPDSFDEMADCRDGRRASGEARGFECPRSMFPERFYSRHHGSKHAHMHGMGPPPPPPHPAHMHGMGPHPPPPPHASHMHGMGPPPPPPHGPHMHHDFRPFNWYPHHDGSLFTKVMFGKPHGHGRPYGHGKHFSHYYSY